MLNELIFDTVRERALLVGLSTSDLERTGTKSSKIGAIVAMALLCCSKECAVKGTGSISFSSSSSSMAFMESTEVLEWPEYVLSGNAPISSCSVSDSTPR
ncbi:hypothetical protein OGATHE_003816 [Ogataea polymorpha]|uniref:Uncharacterized protein n=1 Tax=Ogataea polymorpha TaxID=460523 RepID=A0A9P8T4L7_9ASCO|nr:hypothetical protein OGATHE_003816 [Ogataea polymorpha]